MTQPTCTRCAGASIHARSLCKRCYDYLYTRGLIETETPPRRQSAPYGYTASEVAQLSTLINALGPWRPARWHKPLAAWMEEVPA